MGNTQNNQSQTDQEKQEKEKMNEKSIKSKFNIEQSQQCFVQIPCSDEWNGKSDITINGIRFWSTFDSGNLKSVQTTDNELFFVTIASDCEGRNPPLFFNKCERNWFYFKIQSQEDREITIQMINVSKKSSKMWMVDQDVYMKIGKQWDRYSGWIENESKPTWKISLKTNTKISLAFCQPWSYKQNQKYIEKIENKLKLQSEMLQNQNQTQIYFRKEVISQSLEGRNIELLTITSKNSQFEQSSYYCDQLFPQKQKLPNPIKFSKPYILISARIHAGEVPSSYMLQGVLNELISDSKLANELLNKFVFLIIPMLNPDGVYRGHQRLDALGYDQNRIYNRCDKHNKFQGPLSVIETAKHYNVTYYIDLHSHSTISNSFAFTNQHPDKTIQEEILLFNELLSTAVPHFTYNPKTIFKTKKYLIQYEIEGQYTIVNKSDCSTLNLQKPYLDEINQDYGPYHLNKQLTGVAKTDIYLLSSAIYTYTLEINYRYYVKEKITIKYQTSDFVDLGYQLLHVINQHSNIINN